MYRRATTGENMQNYILITLLIAKLRNTIVTSQSKQVRNIGMQYHFDSNTFYQNWQLQAHNNPLNMLSPLLNPLFSQLYSTSTKTNNNQMPPSSQIVSQSDSMHVSSEENSTFFQNIVNSLSNVETHDKLITTNNSYNGEINSSAAVEYLPTITTPFIDSLAHGIIGGLQQHVQLITPGTKWCGDGNKARSYEDVGVLYKTDKCCRMHDKCPYYILARETKYGLYNDGHFTRSHCDCDASFYDCLKKVNSPFSAGVGIAYFNVLKMKCFRFEHPIVMCSRMAGCQESIHPEHVIRDTMAVNEKLIKRVADKEFF